MTDSSNNPKVTITNNSGVDVDIYDVYNPSGKADQYTYTKLDTLENGANEAVQTIHAARNYSRCIAAISRWQR